MIVAVVVGVGAVLRLALYLSSRFGSFPSCTARASCVVRWSQRLPDSRDYYEVLYVSVLTPVQPNAAQSSPVQSSPVKSSISCRGHPSPASSRQKTSSSRAAIDTVAAGSCAEMATGTPYDQFLLFGDSITEQAGCQDRGFGFAPALQDGKTPDGQCHFSLLCTAPKMVARQSRQQREPSGC